ncbi:MAG: BTAD domain-containing putative transcriptional regulator [Actinomycetota bacterium]
MASDAENLPARLRVEVLGPLELIVDGKAVEVPGPKRRALLAMLAMAEGRAVAVDVLLDALWPSELPESARASLQSHVSRLRGHLGPGASRLQGRGGAYRLQLNEGEIDAAQARTLLAKARDRSVDPAEAYRLLRKARELWRGAVLADLREVETITAWAVSLDELRRELEEQLIARALDAGEVVEAVGLATKAVAEDPLRESGVLLLMRALAEAGRAAEALGVGHEYRRRLIEETGLDASVAVAEIEAAIAGGEMGGGLASGAGGIPRPPMKLLGRQSEVAALHRLLARERLVTVVGPGGVGKTRLALEVARRSSDAKAFMLAPVTDPRALPHALAAALDLRVGHGDVLSACAALLGAGPQLLLVDNCEHLLDPVREVASTLLESCPALTILATSREPLGLPLECTSRLAPLALPSPEASGDLLHLPAVAIFVDRASRVRPGFTPTSEELVMIGDVVRRLDGMPLAIELAAGRLSSFSLPDLLSRLDRSLDMLEGGRTAAEARHRTLRATIEWSYDLLPSEEQLLFRHLAVFPDGVDLATAEMVAADLAIPVDAASALAHLVDASMIDAQLDGPPRYRMLETLRRFGLAQLETTNEGNLATVRLIRWAVDLAAWINSAERSEDEPEGDAVLRREQANLREAWRSARRMDLIDDAITLVVYLEEIATWRDLTEIWGWSHELVRDEALAGHPRVASVFGIAAINAWTGGDLAEAERLVRRGLDLASSDEERWWCLSALALVELGKGSFSQAITHAVDAANLGDHPDQNLGIAAMAAVYSGRLDEARDLNERLGAVAVSPTLIALYRYGAGEIENAAGHPELADEHYARAIELARRSGANFLTGVASVGLMTTLTNMGRIEEALRGYEELIDYWERTGGWIQQWTTLRNLARLLHTLADHEPATFLEIAADCAPDAPAVAETPADETAEGTLSNDETARLRAEAESSTRARVLEVARDAIARRLSAAVTPG